jgi:hypothetical protein
VAILWGLSGTLTVPVGGFLDHVARLHGLGGPSVRHCRHVAQRLDRPPRSSG